MVQKGNSPGQKLEREQEGGREIEEERGRRRRIKAGETEPAMTFSVAEEATIASAGDNRACSNGRSGENKCGSGKGSRGRGGTEYGNSS